MPTTQNQRGGLGEGLLLGAVTTLAYTGSIRKAYLFRSRHNLSMDGAIQIFKACWYLLAFAVAAYILNLHDSADRSTPLDLAGLKVLFCTLAVLLIVVVQPFFFWFIHWSWTVNYRITHRNDAPSRLVPTGHWVTFLEAQQAEAFYRQRLQQMLPAAALAGAMDWINPDFHSGLTTGVVGAIGWEQAYAPWQWWKNTLDQLMLGRTVWVQDRPPMKNYHLVRWMTCQSFYLIVIIFIATLIAHSGS